MGVFLVLISSPMNFRLIALGFLGGTLFFSGCASTFQPSSPSMAEPETEAGVAGPAPRSDADMTATAGAGGEESVARMPAPVAHKKPAPTKPRVAAPETGTLKAGEVALMVESEPSGATVVVNGKPCGKTPCRVVVRANRRGFLREQVSIKVRFIATTSAQSSRTVEDVLTTLDKVPAAIRFTVEGPMRVVK